LGGQDRGITPDDVHKFEAVMKQPGKKIEIKIHDDAGHAFENPNNKDGYALPMPLTPGNEPSAF
jgi:carboxymethylenebutenolidase